MKTRILILTLILTSFIGYLEWGGDNASFLLEAEYDVLKTLFINPKKAAHPFTLIPLLGQILLLIALLLKNPPRFLVYSGIVCTGLLLGFMCLIGLIGMNLKILISTLPYISVSALLIQTTRRNQKALRRS